MFHSLPVSSVMILSDQGFSKVCEAVEQEESDAPLGISSPLVGGVYPDQ